MSLAFARVVGPTTQKNTFPFLRRKSSCTRNPFRVCDSFPYIQTMALGTVNRAPIRILRRKWRYQSLIQQLKLQGSMHKAVNFCNRHRMSHHEPATLYTTSTITPTCTAGTGWHGWMDVGDVKHKLCCSCRGTCIQTDKLPGTDTACSPF